MTEATMHNTITPDAEVKVQIREMGSDIWRDSIDMDPIMVPVEMRDANGELWLTDVFATNVIRLINAIISADDSGNLEYNVVWSETGRTVSGNCPVCDDAFAIAEGAPGDELNEGYDAVFCGCDPADVD
jgi:hypothetical protein